MKQGNLILLVLAKLYAARAETWFYFNSLSSKVVAGAWEILVP